MKKYNRNLIVLLRVVYQIFFAFFAKVAPHSAKIVISIEYFVEICLALVLVTATANAACAWYFHQPEFPKEANALRKHYND